MTEFERGLLDWCKLQRSFMQKALDNLDAGWTMRDPGGDDETAQFKASLSEKIAELDLVIAELEARV